MHRRKKDYAASYPRKECWNILIARQFLNEFGWFYLLSQSISESPKQSYTQQYRVFKVE